jgi:hypothetical protein
MLKCHATTLSISTLVLQLALPIFSGCLILFHFLVIIK